MIRHRRGDEFLLITQDDHARLSGRLATHLGNDRFARPSLNQAVVDGIGLHDCGWPLHDEQAPTLNGRGEPLHVLESPMSVATTVWRESARRAYEVGGPYAGLLVSLHVLRLSDLAGRPGDQPHERARDARDRFELNKFQHQQVEHQEALRRALGLRTDLPLRLGLARPGTGPEEDLLLFNFGLLRAMDQVSLDACSSEDLFPTIDEVYPRPGEPPLTINVGHPAPFTLSLDPWPFDLPRLQFDIRCRRLPARPFENEQTFRDAYRAAPVGSVAIVVRP